MWIVSRVIPVLKLYFTGLKVLLYQLWNTRFLLPVLANQNGRVAIVTGGARGLGYETVRQLVNLGMFVIIASRNEEEALCAVKKISEENSEAQVDFEFLDVSCLRSVREFVRRFKDRGRPLHVLINNAGVMLLPEGRTADGFETHFATNYLGHFLLTRLLLETLVHSGKDESYSRILNVSSSAHHAADLRLHDLQNVRCHSAHEAYSGSKLAQVMFTYHLCEELESSGAPVTVNAVDPGVVNTGLYSHLCCLTRYAHKLIAHFLFKTPADGAATAVYSALSPHLERVSGCYLHEGRCVESSSNSYDKDLQTRLWQNTCDLLNLQHSLELHAHITPELK
ncbi:dehydrogenase/reductase SDR family member on chromosome X-like isoform X1 [Triplophysa dalaica]|uniref:dehydrogenase/reductase SDR family member on chromosome X-like isoform X1 n=1 Tax=Triplophysa dalaica TaxID=1582913 RepID=UPI0024DF7E55|nr:dehydrogenase/reductase SDR family member on chromosome X-like isoform X1 [Triplophysa dalaica]